jgi:hypothetical protein
MKSGLCTLSLGALPNTKGLMQSSPPKLIMLCFALMEALGCSADLSAQLLHTRRMKNAFPFFQTLHLYQ